MMKDQQVLLVAGPSGGGKSEFLRQLRAGTLPEHLVELLPRGCPEWPVAEANNMLKEGWDERRLLESCGAKDRVIFHYDITFVHRRALGYAQDPFCKGLASARELPIIYIKPDLDQLLRQYDGRLEAHRATKSRPHLIWADWVRMPMKRAALRREGLPAADVADLYRSPGFLQTCYAEWEAYISELRQLGTTIHLHVLRPELGSAEQPSFAEAHHR
jgi:hypothetical protein